MITLIGRYKDIMTALKEAIKNGYGDMPAEWSIKLWLSRN